MTATGISLAGHATRLAAQADRRPHLGPPGAQLEDKEVAAPSIPSRSPTRDQWASPVDHAAQDKGARPPRAPLRHPASHHISPGQRLGQTECERSESL